MKVNFLLGALALVLGWMTCKNLQKAAAPASAPANSEEAAAPAKMPAQDDSETADLLRVPVDDLPPATASHRAYLSSAYWHLSMAVSPRDENVQPYYEKKWLVFRQDQTFDILIEGKVVDTGRWNWDVDKNVIYLSCKDPYINNTWAVKDLMFLMIWIGNTDLNKTGIQIKVQGHKQSPWGGQEKKD